MEYFEQTAPQSVGVGPKGIIRVLERIRKSGMEIHSLMVVRHGKCCAAGWWAPYGSEYVHPLYSFSKTLTSVAVGFAVQEGKLGLDEKLVDIFPDETPEEPSENLKKVAVRHLLTMSCGHGEDFMDFSENWIENFLRKEFVYEPGTTFIYNTGGTNMLAAILKKKTGCDVTEYLRPRLLDPLGIRELPCIVLPDKYHTQLGGGGMRMKTEDMAKFAVFLLNKGMWEGKQLLNRAWFDQACARLVETRHVFGDGRESSNGYGYQIWQGSRPGSYRAEGAFGQCGLAYPDLDLAVAVTAAVEQSRVQEIFDIINEELLPAVQDGPLPDTDDSGMLSDMLKDLRIPVLRGDRNPSAERRLKDREYCAEKKPGEEGCSSLEILIGGGNLYPLTGGEITRMSFSFEDRAMVWKVWENQRIIELKAGMDGSFARTGWDGNDYAACARWRDISSLELEARRLDSLSGVRIIFRFEGDSLSLEADETLIAEGGASNYPKHVTRFRPV